MTEISNWVCSTPSDQAQRITLNHGGGGRLSAKLLNQCIVPSLGADLQAEHDSAVVEIEQSQLAFTTDSYVVEPRFFPGGNIGSLAVYGTANDLAVVGARPVALSCGLILEEGVCIQEVESVLTAMRHAAEEVGVPVVTGDTKVVEKGKCDGIYVNTSGVGEILVTPSLHPHRIQVGDAILVSGDLGRHGACVLATRHHLDTQLQSDCAFLGRSIYPLLDRSFTLHCARDLTRGGLVSSLMELAKTAKLSFRLKESDIPVIEPVRGVCELLGLDAMHLANEGRCVLFAPRDQASEMLSVLRDMPGGEYAADIGEVLPKGRFELTLETRYGTERVVTQTLGEQLPRIC